MLDRLKEERIHLARLIIHRLSLENMAQGFHIMRDKTEDYIKTMAIL